MLEKKIQNELVKYLKSQGYFVILPNGVVDKGIPDVLVCIRGNFCAIEVKAPGKTPTKLQSAYHRKLREQKVCVWVEDSIQLERTKEYENNLGGLRNEF